MKKVLIFGAAVTEFRSYVTRLPKGNEDFETLRTEQRISGSGAVCAYTFSHFGFPYAWNTNLGEGVYADYVESMLQKYHVDGNYRKDDIAGCLYRLMDRNENSNFMIVPGSEYDFLEETVEEIDVDEYSSILIFGESLTGQCADALVDFISRCELPIYFVPGERTDEIEEGLLEAMLTMSDVLFVNEQEAYYLADEEFDDLSECAKKLQFLSEGTVAILKNGEGLYVNDGEESYIAPETSFVDEIQCASALFVALHAKIDFKNACMYAVRYASSLHGEWKKENQFELERRRLAEIILH